MPAKHPVPQKQLLREIRRFQKKIRQATARRARHVPVSARRPKLRGSRPSEELGRLLLTLAERLSQHPSWRNYTWREDLVAASMPALLHACAVYDLSRKTSPFSYLTMTAWRCFVKETRKQNLHGIRAPEGVGCEVIPFPDTPHLGVFAQGASGERFATEGW